MLGKPASRRVESRRVAGMVRSLALAHQDALKDLNASCTQAIKEVDGYIETQRQTAITKQDKEKENAAKEQVRIEKAAQKEKDALAKKAASSAGRAPSETMPSILFDLGASSVEPLAVFRDNEHLEKTKTEVTDGFMTCPYAISKVPDILAVADGKDVKSSQGVFHVQFSMSDQVKKTKHGQYPMQTSKNDALRELALTQGPKVATIKMTGPAAKEQIAVRRFITSCSHFGFMPQCVINGEVERFAMPSYRYQLKGRREVLFVSYDDLSRFFPMEAICS